MSKRPTEAVHAEGVTELRKEGRDAPRISIIKMLRTKKVIYALEPNLNGHTNVNFCLKETLSSTRRKFTY